MNRMRRRDTAIAASLLLGVLAAGGGIAPAVADSATPAVPDDVDAWFDEEASQLITQARREAITLDGDEKALTSAALDVGEPRAVSTWTVEFRSGIADAPATTSLPQWIAPVSDGGAAVGTVSAYRDRAGAVALAYFDDATVLADGLRVLGEEQHVVYDGPLDAYFRIDGSTIAPLSESSRVELAAPVPLEAFQDQLATRYAGEETGATLPRTDPRSSLAGGGASVPTRTAAQAGPGAGIGLPVGVGLALVSAAALVLSFRRGRRASSQGDVG